MRTVCTFFWVYISFFSLIRTYSQEKSEKVVLKKDYEIQKHTFMERFEPDYVLSAEKRADMKKKRIEDAEHTLGVLDTMKISNRKRNQLLRDLKYNPFSERLTKFMVDTKFDDAVHQED